MTGLPARTARLRPPQPRPAGVTPSFSSRKAGARRADYPGQRIQCGLVNKRPPSHAPAMFVVTEEDAAAIRALYEQRGEFAAAIELRQRFPGITDNAQARECARTIAGWKPLPLRPVKRAPKVPRAEHRG